MASQPLALSVESRFHAELIGLPREAQKKVARALRELQRDPRHLSEPLKGQERIWRCRVGAYRVLFAPGEGWVHVYSVQHRSGVYAGGIATPVRVPATERGEFPPLPEEGEEEGAPEGGRKAPLAMDGDRLRTQGLGEELVQGILACQSTEDLLGLIDLGLPDHLFNELLGLLAGGDKSGRRSRPVELVRSDVIDHFFGRVLRLPSSKRALELTVVSPWITPWQGKTSSLKAVIKYARLAHVRTTIITRPPEFDAHERAIEMLAALSGAEVVFLPQLHAKFFICELAPIPFALVGSANATMRSLSNFEIGVLVRGVGTAEAFVRDLQGLVTELRSFGERIKKRGAT